MEEKKEESVEELKEDIKEDIKILNERLKNREWLIEVRGGKSREELLDIANNPKVFRKLNKKE